MTHSTCQSILFAGNHAAAAESVAAAQGPGPRPPAARLDGHWGTPSSQLQLGCFPAVLLPPGVAGAGVDVGGQQGTGVGAAVSAVLLTSGAGTGAAGPGEGARAGAAGKGAGEGAAGAGGAGGGCWVRVRVSNETSSGSHKVSEAQQGRVCPRTHVPRCYSQQQTPYPTGRAPPTPCRPRAVVHTATFHGIPQHHAPTQAPAARTLPQACIKCIPPCDISAVLF